jgi:hypothetical protein
MTTQTQPPRIRDDFANALVRSAKLDSPRPGARARALSRLDARARASSSWLGCRADRAHLLGHGFRMATSAALIAGSIGWAVAAPSAPYDTTSATGCPTSNEWAPPPNACSDRTDRGDATLLGGGSGGSSGSSSG